MLKRSISIHLALMFAFIRATDCVRYWPPAQKLIA